MSTLQSLDQSLFLFLNGLHCSFLDPVMWYGTQTLYWTPLFLLLLYAVIRRYGWRTLWVLLFAAIMILVSDQLAGFFKELTARPRPSHNAALEGIHTLNGYVGGTFGFYSSHASNTLALAVFLVIILRGSWRWFPPLILLWAFFMAYTRIYLGVHYPADILAGWMAGGVIGWGMGRVCRRVVIP